MAERFLACLAPGEDSTFQTFDDSPAKNRALARVMHGTLSWHAGELQALNLRGAGAFAMVNRGDLQGRSNKNVTGVRAAFIDLDGAPLEPVLAAAVQPHIIVESSPDRWHAYWRLLDCTIGQFKPVQKALAARFNGDPAVCDLPRVMRLPGFLHRKSESFQTRILSIDKSLQPYKVAELLTGLGVTKIETADGVEDAEHEGGLSRGTGGDGLSRGSTDSSVILCSTSGKELVLPRMCIPLEPGHRNASLFQLARLLKGGFPDDLNGEVRKLVVQWHGRFIDRIGTKEFAETWDDFSRSWGAVLHPVGGDGDDSGAQFRSAQALAASLPVPDGVLALNYGESAISLTRLCLALQMTQDRARGHGQPFFLSSRKAGEWVGKSHPAAAAILRTLCADGLLELTDEATTFKAARYRFVGAVPPQQPLPAPFPGTTTRSFLIPPGLPGSPPARTAA